MAAKKLGRGKGVGALMRNLSSPPAPGPAAANGVSERLKDPNVVLEVRVTEVTDVTSFWVQMGTAAQLEEYDVMCRKLAAWCSEKGRGTVALPLVGNIIAVADKSLETWSRAEVTKQISDCVVEVFFVDTGCNARVNLSDVCEGSPPMLFSLPRQAARCTLQGIKLVEGEEANSERVTRRFTELVQVPPGSIKAVINSKSQSTITATLFIQYEGSWISIAEILKKECLVQYNPVGAVTINHVTSASSEDDVISDDATPTPTHSYLADSPTPVPSETSVDFGPQTPLDTPPVTPACSPLVESEEHRSSPPSLVESSVDNETEDKTAEVEDLEEPTVSNSFSNSAVPVLSISLLKSSEKQQNSFKPWPISASQVKQPQLATNWQRNQASVVVSSNGGECTTWLTSSGDGGELAKASKLSSSSSPEPPLTSESPDDDKTPRPAQFPPMINGEMRWGEMRWGEEEEKGQPMGVSDKEKQGQRQKRLTDTTATTEEEEEEEEDVVEVEDDSEVEPDASLGAGEKDNTGARADSTSSDDEWDESLLPPRSGSSGGSPLKSDEIAEVEEYFHRRDMKGSRRLWGQNNSAQNNSGTFHKNSKPYYQRDQRRYSPTYHYRQSLHRWGGYVSPGENPDSSYQGRGRTSWCPGVGRGRHRRGIENQQTRYGGTRMKRDGAGSGGNVNGVDETGAVPVVGGGGGGGGDKEAGGGILGECPKLYPPTVQYINGVVASQLVKRPAGRGRGRGDRDRHDSYQSMPFQQRYPPVQSYASGISQSQIVRKEVSSWQDYGRSSSASEGESVSVKPSTSQLDPNESWSQRRENRYGSAFHQNQGSALGSGCDQPPPLQSYSSQQIASSSVYRGLTEEQIKNEVGWYTSALERAVKKIISSLTSSSTDQFGAKILELLGDSKAQKLLDFSSNQTPLEVIMLSVVKGVVDMEWTDSSDVVNAAIENLIDAAPHQACSFLHSSLVEKATEISRSSGMNKTSKRFCSFLGKLFISASYSDKEEYSASVGQAVKDCLDIWCSMNTSIPNFQKAVYAECFSYLCDEIGPTIDDSSRENLDAYFNKQVRENILSEKLPRQVKEIFFDLHTRRVNAWDGRKKVEPPSEEAPPSMETTPTPRTPLTPTSVSDYPEKVELPLPPPPPPPTNRIVQPVPISTTSMATAYPVTNTFYHHGDTTANTCTPTAIGGAGGEIQGGIGSVNVVSPHLPQTCSAFIPAAAVQHQQHLQRAQSLPAAHNLQQVLTPVAGGVRSNSLSDVPTEDPYSPYAQVTEMLSSLSLMDLLPRFEDYMIKDYVLDCERENIKSCLQEASIPMGAVVGILDYIEKRRKSKKTSSSHQQQRSIGGTHPPPPLTPVQLMPHSVFTPDASRSSAPTPVPPPYYTGYHQQHQQQTAHLEVQYPVVGSQLGPDNITPSNYNMASLYPPPQQQQQKHHQVKAFEAPQTPIPFSTAAQDSTNQQLHQQPAQLQKRFPLPQQQLPYQQQESSSSSSVAMLTQTKPYPQCQPQQQQAVEGHYPQAREVQKQRVPAISLPRSSLSDGNLTTSPTTAQRRMNLPTGSPRGPQQSRQLQLLSLSHHEEEEERTTTSSGSHDIPVQLPSSATPDDKFSSSLASPSSQQQQQSEAPPAPNRVGGFGSISCVCCGSNSHKTPLCPNRSKFFF